MNQGCRIVGCVAIGRPAAHRVSRIRLDGLCIAHQQFPADELRVLLKRKAGGVAPLKTIICRIEFRRANGTCYGYDRDGDYYDVPVLPVVPPQEP